MPVKVKIDNVEDSRGKVRRHVEPSTQTRVDPPKPARPKDLIGGPHTDSYELFVQRLFSPPNTKKAPLTGTYYDETRRPPLLHSPMDMLTEYGVYNKPEPQFHVYRTKSSSEYFATMNKKPMIYDSPCLTYKAAKTITNPNYFDGVPTYDEPNYRLTVHGNRSVAAPSDRAKHMLIDYKDFSSSPLSPYMYLRHEFVHPNDSRIIGSDFVMLSLRGNDNFMNKVDKTLAEAKKFNRWWD